MPEPTSTPYVGISLALISVGDLFVMQLRDFTPEIDAPGSWGFFAGHFELGERAHSTMWRELREELGWQPEVVTFLGVTLTEDRRINVVHCDCYPEASHLTLHEGEDMGFFSAEQFSKGTLFSDKLQGYYPVAPVALRVFKQFLEGARNASQDRSGPDLVSQNA